MKHIKIIYTTLLIYIVLAISIPFVADIYVDKKDNREYDKALRNLEDFFAKQEKFISINYSGEKVAYEKISIPKYKESLYSFNKEKDKLDWNERWGDVYKLYKLKPRYSSDQAFASDDSWTGWCFTVIEKRSFNSFYSYLIYPYQVAYKRQNERWMYNDMPSVQSAIDDAFDFYINNEESSYKQYLTSENEVSIYDVKAAISPSYNSYYKAFSYDEEERYFDKEELDSILYSKNINKMSNTMFEWSEVQSSDTQYLGNIHNGYYKVEMKCQPMARWIINYNFRIDPKQHDWNKFVLYSESFLFILVLIIILPLGIKESKRRKFAKESLKNKLLRLCIPQQFMKPYDEMRVSTANNLYEKIVNTPDSDTITLKKLRKEASMKLGIDFLDKSKKKLLLASTNPKKFMKPYDAEKIRIANTLYTQLINDLIDVDSLEEIEREIREKLS